MIYIIFSIIFAYLIGSVNFAVIFVKLFSKKDIRKFGSGNPGSTNAMRIGGKLPGTLTFICDFFKGTLASFVGLKVFEHCLSNTGFSWCLPVYGAYICGIACMFGHVFPIFFGFKGGKGVATGAGVFLAFCPLATVIGLLTFALVTIVSGYVSIGSLIASAVVVVAACMLDNSG